MKRLAVMVLVPALAAGAAWVFDPSQGATSLSLTGPDWHSVGLTEREYARRTARVLVVDGAGRVLLFECRLPEPPGGPVGSPPAAA